MPRKVYDRVTVGWRVIGLKRNEDGTETLQPLSRVYHSKPAAQEFVELARQQGFKEPYVAEVSRPERYEHLA
jgi:hypothetical protein